MTDVGLIVITLAWLYQLITVASGDKRIQPVFAGLYAAGVVVLIADAFMGRLVVTALLNVLALVAALGVLALLINKKHADPSQS